MIIPSALMGVTDYVYVAGVPANPTSITAVLYRWVGATRSASGVTVTCTAVGSGEYRFTWTNDAGWARTDELELVALPVVSGVSYPAAIWRSHGGVDAVMRGTDGAMPLYTQPTGFLAAVFPIDPADQSLVVAATDAILTAVGTKSSQTSVDAVQADTNDIQTRLPVALVSGRMSADSQGAGGGDASQATLLAVQATAVAIAASLAGTPIEVTGRVASGGAIALYVGDDCTVASGTALQIPVSDPAGGLFAILNALSLSVITFGASRGNKASSLISGTVAALAQSGSGADTLCIISVEIIAAGTATGCVVADDYEYQIATRTGAADDFVRIDGALDLRARRVAIPV